MVTRDDLDERLTVTEVNLDQRLAVAEAGLDWRLGVTEADLKTAVAESRPELLKWAIGLLLGQTANIAALVKLL